jgi:very-short-patch-repair endonuclease
MSHPAPQMRHLPQSMHNPLTRLPVCLRIRSIVVTSRDTCHVLIEVPRSLREQVSLQAGVLTRQQALNAGLPGEVVAWRVRSERWATIYPGIYATFTGPVSRTARLWAIALYAGPQARLSHQTAAELHRLSDEHCPLVHVSIPGSRRVRAPEGVVVHRRARLDSPWRPVGLPPHTFIDETIIDLVAAAADLDEVIAIVTGAFGRKLASEAHLKRLAGERARLRWRKELGQLIEECARGAHSPLEYRHDRDVQRAHGLPEPVKQARFRKQDGSWGYRDRCYPQYGGLVIELDGKRFHREEQRGRDTDRDNEAAVSGATLRYGWDSVTRTPCETAKQQAEALRNRGWTGSLNPCSPSCRAVPAQVNDRRDDLQGPLPGTTAGGRRRTSIR